MNRETKIIETPIDKYKVELLCWITGREKRILARPFLEHAKIASVGVDREEPSGGFDKNPADILEEVENITIKTVVVSINGKKENVLDCILDMKKKDFEFVVSAVNSIAKDEPFLATGQKL